VSRQGCLAHMSIPSHSADRAGRGARSAGRGARDEVGKRAAFCANRFTVEGGPHQNATILTPSNCYLWVVAVAALTWIGVPPAVASSRHNGAPPPPSAARAPCWAAAALCLCRWFTNLYRSEHTRSF